MSVRVESGTVLQREGDELSDDALAVAPAGLGLGEGVLVRPAATTVAGAAAQMRRKASAAIVRAMNKWYGGNRDWRTVRLPQRP